MKEEIVYLSFFISADGRKMDPKKVKVILDWPTLENVGEVRSFHGLKFFYRNFMTSFSSVCNAMTKTLRGDRNNFK